MALEDRCGDRAVCRNSAGDDLAGDIAVMRADDLNKLYPSGMEPRAERYQQCALEI
jgi:hypothetical protein